MTKTMFFVLTFFIAISCSSSKSKFAENNDEDVFISDDSEGTASDDDVVTSDHEAILPDKENMDTDKNNQDADFDELPDKDPGLCENEQCEIEGECFDEGQKSPSHLCHVCDVSQNKFDWTPVESGTICRVSSGECDIAEKCDGISGNCPEDMFKPVDEPCGDSSDTECDKPDSCDGYGVCRKNYVEEFTACTDDEDDCNGPESCDGSGSCISQGPDVICGDREVCNPDSGECVCDEDNSFFISPDKTFCAFAGNNVYPTKQSKCYNATEEIACPTYESGLPFFGQDAQYTDNPSTFTISGDSPDQVVTDSLTGLTWELDFDDTKRDWSSAKHYCTSKGNDWRLPTIKELMTTLHFDHSAPACDPEYCPGYSGYFWSSTEDIEDSSKALNIYFYTGDIRSENKTENDAVYVRCVKGTPFNPTGTISVNEDVSEPVATDSMTGLSWTRTMDDTATWEEALDGCETLNYSGHEDWRLPNVHELLSVIKYNSTSGTTELPNIETNLSHWTSTTFSGLETGAFYFSFTSGKNARRGKTHKIKYVCVR